MTALLDRDFSIAHVKTWLLQMIECLGYLHDRGIVHRDVVVRNFLVGERVVIADLQCKYSSTICRAPEVKEYEQYSTASDVCALGTCIWQFCYRNNPPLCAGFLDLTVPKPFDTVYEACAKVVPEDRPTLPELWTMVENIEEEE